MTQDKETPTESNDNTENKDINRNLISSTNINNIVSNAESNESLVKRLNFNSNDFTIDKFEDLRCLSGESRQIIDEDISIIDNKEKVISLEVAKERIKEVIQNLNINLSNIQIEESYNNKISIVNDLMEKLHYIISDVNNIKDQMPKPPKPLYSTFNRRIVSLKKSSNDLDQFNKSTVSKKSLSSSRSKMLTFKPPLSKIIVPNKYTVMSPKVSINIAFGKKTAANNQVNQVELNLEQNDRKILNSTKSTIRLNKDLDSSLNSTKTKKLNSKKTNLSLPGSSNMSSIKKDKNSQNLRDNKSPMRIYDKNSLDNSGISSKTTKTFERNEKNNLNFKFEPKKKNLSKDNNSNITESTTHHVSAKQSEDINRATRNVLSSNNMTFVNHNTGVYKSLYKTIENKPANRTFIDFTYSINISSPVKSILLLEPNSKIRTLILNFLLPKDRLKLRILSKQMLRDYIEYETNLIKKQIEDKKLTLSNNNPFKNIKVSSEIISKSAKITLVLSDYKKKLETLVDSSSKQFMTYLGFFVNCIYVFFFLKYDSNIDIQQKIALIENNVINSNCYFCFEAVLDNIQNKKELFDLVKELYNKDILKFNLLESTLPNSDFKYFNDLFKVCKKVVDDDRKMMQLLDCEILEDKIDRIKNKLV